MPVKLVLGLQHGDEGKGRVVDDLVHTWADIIVRFQGGGNAGHTVYDEKGNKFVTHTLPVGVLNKQKFNLITKGCVINILELYREIKELNVSPENLKVSGLCPIIQPSHIFEDMSKYVGKIGTTAKGIGPAYSAFYARDAILFKDFIFDLDNSIDKMNKSLSLFKENYIVHTNTIHSYEKAKNQLDLIIENKAEIHNTLKQYYLKNEFILKELLDRNILLEGAQGSGLSINSENYPNVTSSYPTIGGALNATNLNHKEIDEVIGVIKSYKTKVGSGEFRSLCSDPKDSNTLASFGKEFGATTGRPRKCGWLDLDEVIEACRVNGVDHICVVKTDVLTNVLHPYVYFKNTFVKIQYIKEVDHNHEPFKNLLNLIKAKTDVNKISYTTGPNRGQIIWNPKLM